MNGQNKKRLFIALNLPQNIKDEITDLIKKLAKLNKGANIKWVSLKNMHLTLHFLGYVDKELEEQVKLAMQGFQGKFGQLQFELGKKLIQLGIRVDQRPWKPHLTLGRAKERCNFNTGNYKIKTKEFSIDSFELMESMLKPTGAEYRKVISCMLDNR